MFGKWSVETLAIYLVKSSGKRILVKEDKTDSGNNITGDTSYGSTVITLRSILNSFESEAKMTNSLLKQMYSLKSLFMRDMECVASRPAPSGFSSI